MGYGMQAAELRRSEQQEERRRGAYQRKLLRSRSWYAAHRTEAWERRNCQQPGPLVACCEGQFHALVGPPYRTACCGRAVLLEGG